MRGDGLSPGNFLRTVMGVEGLTQAELAWRLGIPVQAVNEICNEKKSITPRVALLLERELDVNAEIWLTLQARFVLRREREKTR